ncbi:interleukin-31 receptor subunit alpha [Pteronotus mesoamericanus]|uniref:interleukin-31 receptor subunit alpha n=1 Tax=Pteronotus mesoamericanus TaxID=1884717 RepID=UPI0023EC11DA|nr:interleukin-31 receptor subunit alpha [Pteronotus parnellii mesoamericanus]
MGTALACAWWLLPLLCGLARAALPAKPENVSCIFYYTKNFTCTWSPEREASYTKYQVKRTHTNGNDHDTCNSTSEDRASCSFYHRITYPDQYTIQVQAQNADGTVESDATTWDLDTIVKIDPPVISEVERVPGAKRMLLVRWTSPALAPVSSTLNCTLRFRPTGSDRWMEVSFETEANRDHAFNLTGLQAFTEYVIALQCATNRSKFQSGWSPEQTGTTEEEAPLGLDVWRVLGPARADGQRPVKLLWKVRGALSQERTLGYLIQYFPENSTHLAKTVNTTGQQLELYLDQEAYQVSMVAYNSFGQSPEATLRVPAATEKPFRCIEALQTGLAGDQLVVAWQGCDRAVDTWMVEWLPDQDMDPSTLCWEPVSQARNWTMPRHISTPFCCYNISVYPMLQDLVGEPYSVQAYAEQGVPSAGPAVTVESIGVKTVTITWSEVPKSQRNGFIRNYTIFYQAEDGAGASRTVGPRTLRYSLESLARGTPYTLQVMASTLAGGTNGTRINFKTLSISVLEIGLLTLLVGSGLLILLVLAVTCGLRNPTKSKCPCWPQVPNPAQSSIAMWPGDGLQNTLNLKEFEDSVNMQDRILKPCSAPRDLIDKVVVNFENFLEEASTEESAKGQENILGGETNEYVTSPLRLYSPPGRSSGEPLLAAEVAPREPQPPRSRRPGGEEPLLPSAQGAGPARALEDGAANPYLKNSVTTREFLASETRPGQTPRGI